MQPIKYIIILTKPEFLSYRIGLVKETSAGLQLLKTKFFLRALRVFVVKKYKK
jgi:hypothetical protein